MAKKATTGEKKAKKPAKPRTYPKYGEMVASAILHLKDRTGSSSPAIEKYILANYTVPEPALHTRLKLALKKGVEKGELEKVKNSYKLQSASRDSYLKVLKQKGEAPEPVRRVKKTSESSTRGRSATQKTERAERAATRKPKSPSASPKKAKSPSPKKAKSPSPKRVGRKPKAVSPKVVKKTTKRAPRKAKQSAASK